MVVIGILIALQINNCNEGRKAAFVEQQYLEALRDEFKSNLAEVNRVITSCDSAFRSCKQVINKMDEDGQRLTDLELQQAHMNAFRFPPKFTQSPGILNDLINSGYLSKLNNIELRSQLQRWLVTIQEVKDEEDEFWQHREKVIEFMQREYSFRKFMIEAEEGFIGEIVPNDTTKDNVSLFYDEELDNIMLLYSLVMRSLQLHYYPALKENIELILAEIEKSLSE
nr:DUF6090 family protein [Lewinella sp. W8]